MSTSISNTTTDVGVVPHGFGLYTQSYATGCRPGCSRPFNPTVSDSVLPAADDLQQRQHQPGQPAPGSEDQTSRVCGTLPLLSDALDTTIFDPLSFIPAF